MKKTNENIELVKNKAKIVYDEENKKYNAYFGDEEYPSCGFGASREEAIENLILLILR